MNSIISCTICFEELNHRKKGTLENCTHEFCFKCIFDWAKLNNSCPICRKIFQKINGIPIILSERNRLDSSDWVEASDDESSILDSDWEEQNLTFSSLDENLFTEDENDDEEQNLSIDNFNNSEVHEAEVLDTIMNDCDENFDNFSSDGGDVENTSFAELVSDSDQEVFSLNESIVVNQDEEHNVTTSEELLSDEYDQEYISSNESVGIGSETESLQFDENSDQLLSDTENQNIFDVSEDEEEEVIMFNENEELSAVDITETAALFVDSDIDDLNENIFYESDDEEDILEELMDDLSEQDYLDDSFLNNYQDEDSFEDY